MMCIEQLCCCAVVRTAARSVHASSLNVIKHFSFAVFVGGKIKGLHRQGKEANNHSTLVQAEAPAGFTSA